MTGPCEKTLTTNRGTAMPGTVRRALVAVAVVLLACTATLAAHHAPGSGALATQADSVGCANCI